MSQALLAPLVSLHESRDPLQVLSGLEDYLLQAPQSNLPFRDSYAPFVGPEYRPGGLLVVATAQSLAKVVRSRDAAFWEQVTGCPTLAHYRLYRTGGMTVQRSLKVEEVRFDAISIQPWQDGILAAVAGVYLAAVNQVLLSDLNKVTCRIAVTNFYKWSLWSPRKHRDLHPSKLPAQLAESYRAATISHYVRPELEIIAPGSMIGFNRPVYESLCEAAPAGVDVQVINDPAWIKRGMGNMARPKSRWRQTVQDSNIPSVIKRLIEEYIGQMSLDYRGKRIDRTRLYLSYYYLQFRRSRGT